MKPYVKVTTGGRTIAYVNPSQDSAQFDLGFARIKTNQARKRFSQAGCLYASGGNLGCMADVIARERSGAAQGTFNNRNLYSPANTAPSYGHSYPQRGFYRFP